METPVSQRVKIGLITQFTLFAVLTVSVLDKPVVQLNY